MNPLDLSLNNLTANSIKRVIEVIKSGGIGVIPTDTIYGIIGSALQKESVEKIYKVRRRDPAKPFIILISSLVDLELFSISITKKQQTYLCKLVIGTRQYYTDWIIPKFT